MRIRPAAAAALLLAAAPSILPAQDSRSEKPRERLKMSISSSLFQNMPEALIAALMKPFDSLLIAQTGMGGDLISAGNGDAVARNLMDGKIQVGVVEGIEYAWLKTKYPQIRPLMIAVTGETYPRSCLVVRKGSGIRRPADLKGKALAELKDSREHCQLFRDHVCHQAAQLAAKQFFARITQVPNAEAALDDVVDDKVQAAIVDKVCLEGFRRRKPARAERLEVVQLSEPFPASAVIYRDGNLDGATLQCFNRGMLNANQTVLGKQLLTMWKLTAFVPVPADYEERSAKILTEYPPPREQ